MISPAVSIQANLVSLQTPEKEAMQERLTGQEVAERVSSWTMIFFEEDAHFNRRDDTHWALLELAVRHLLEANALAVAKAFFKESAHRVSSLSSRAKPQPITLHGRESLLHRTFQLPGQQAPA
jgi:hypothetical protein